MHTLREAATTEQPQQDLHVLLKKLTWPDPVNLSPKLLAQGEITLLLHLQLSGTLLSAAGRCKGQT